MSKIDNKNNNFSNLDLNPEDLMDLITDAVLDNPSVIATPKTQEILENHRYVNLVSEAIFTLFQTHHKYVSTNESKMCIFIEGKSAILRQVGDRYVVMFGRQKIKAFLLTDEYDMPVYTESFNLDINDIKKKLRLAMSSVEKHYSEEINMPDDIEWSTFEFSEMDYDLIGW